MFLSLLNIIMGCCSLYVHVPAVRIMLTIWDADIDTPNITGAILTSKPIYMLLLNLSFWLYLEASVSLKMCENALNCEMVPYIRQLSAGEEVYWSWYDTKQS